MAKEHKTGTKAIHAGVKPDPVSGAIMTPIYQTSTYVQEGPGEHKGYEYARSQNPTREVLENNIASLENGRYGIAYSSGMAAIDAIIKLLEPGDEVVSTNDLYGGTYRIFRQVFENFGIRFRFISMKDPAAIEDAISDNTKLIWVETPTNPMLQIIDIEKVAQIGKERGITTVVDNTFATPYLQQPLDLGVDMVTHSATKYLGGHSDVVLGLVVTNNSQLADKLFFIQNSCGAVPGPNDCFLALRGVKTLHVRMERHCENARQIAHFLHEQPKTANVYWPGFTDHEGHAVAAKQMVDFGGMVSFDLASGKIDDAKKIMRSTELFSLAESLGGVESLIGHPATMTHASIPKEEREKSGLTDTLIRLSVGIEDVDDLLKDLEIALSKV